MKLDDITKKGEKKTYLNEIFELDFNQVCEEYGGEISNIYKGLMLQYIDDRTIISSYTNKLMIDDDAKALIYSDITHFINQLYLHELSKGGSLREIIYTDNIIHKINEYIKLINLKRLQFMKYSTAEIAESG